ncbi:MAG: DUF5818 domain-containing protein [Candidatus Acidiferrales bacterium]
MRQTRQILLYLASLLLLCVLARGSSGAGDEVFKGEIADSQCAMNVHSLSQSHKEMLEGKSVGTSPGDCVWFCVKQRGGRFVLQNKNKVFKLDDQNIDREFAGQKVLITGTLDKKTNTIHVHSIKLESEATKTSVRSN